MSANRSICNAMLFLVRVALQHELERQEKAVPLRETFAELRRRADERLGPVNHNVDLKKFTIATCAV